MSDPFSGSFLIVMVFIELKNKIFRSCIIHEFSLYSCVITWFNTYFFVFKYNTHEFVFFLIDIMCKYIFFKISFQLLFMFFYFWVDISIV